MKQGRGSQVAPLPGLELPPRAMRQLRRYVELLDKWRSITNLISERSFAEVWSRHIADGHFIYLASPTSRKWLDIGSGAGFPALVLAIILADVEGGQIHCVEADGRKCAFLRLVAQDLGLPVKVHQMRAEMLSLGLTGSVDAVTSRAFSSLSRILSLTAEYLADGAVAVLPRGRSATTEIESLDTNVYRIDATANPGSGDGLIVKVWQKGANSYAARRLSDKGA